MSVIEVRGNASAQVMTAAEFVELHEAALRRVVGRVASKFRLRREDREDLFQESIARFLAAFVDVADAAAAFDFLATTAERVAIDAYRRASIRNDRWLGRVHHYHASSPADPAEVVVRSSQVHAVRAAVRRLPVAQQTAVVLTDITEMSAADGAAVMSINPRAFRSLLHRGRARLRADLRNLTAPVIAAIGRRMPRRLDASNVVPASQAAIMMLIASVALVPVAALHHPVPRVQPTTAPQAAFTRLTDDASDAAVPLAATASARGVKDDAELNSPSGTRPRHLPSPPPPPQVCVVGTTCVGHTKHGDEVCVHNGQDRNVVCQKEAYVALCEHTPATPYTSCTRHGDPEWLVPPHNPSPM